ncbi:hypothetical protein PR048_001956 [Dryococelus australis]|uniref:Uncharacterized protein n=1 Tax=Dryococelus australis TaxID=614101 RepID=A0ABQ9IIT6_9NEOP|nr:hypothetical protein PR048_001956 [Dryococelus australis]
MKLFEKRRDWQRLTELSKQENCPLNVTVDNGIHFLLAMYGAPISETILNTPFKFPSLLTTDAALNNTCIVYTIRYKLG